MTTARSRRRRLLLAIAAGLLWLPALHGTAGAADETLRPNVVVFYVDDLGYADLASYGSPVIHTPHLDRFAAEGVRLTAFYAAAPNCSPSRAGLLTGRFPNRVGMYDIVLNRESMMRLPEDEITVAELLKSVGYDTFHAGKWHMTPERGGASRSALRHGFDFTTESGMLAHNIVRYFDTYLGARTNKDKPLFAYLAIPEPHEPVGDRVRPEFRASYDNAEARAKAQQLPYGRVERRTESWDNASSYFGIVSQIDDAFGKLLEVLDKRGMRENTFVLFASDNGPEHRSHYSFGSPGPLRGAKGHVYEGGIRVPAIVRYPGVVPAGKVVDEPVCGVDLLPTVAALAGVALPDDRPIDGVNVLPALRGEPIERSTPLYWSMWAARGGVQYAMRLGDWKILAETNPLDKQMSVIDHIKSSIFVRYELYDLANDVGETDDLAATNPEKLAELRARFLELHREIVADGPNVPLEEHRNKARAAFPEAYPGRRKKAAADS